MPFLMLYAEADLPLREALEAIRGSVSRADWKWRAIANTPFVGKVYDHGFRILRVVRGRDSFNPVLHGRFRLDARRIKLRVLMTFHPLVWLFLLGWSSYFAHLILAGYRRTAQLDTGALG